MVERQGKQTTEELKETQSRPRLCGNDLDANKNVGRGDK